MNTIRVILADDHSLVRVGVRTLIEQINGIELVAEASNGREALEAIRVHNPDIAMIDISMAGMNGLETTTRITQDYPHVRVIILSIHASEEYVWQALKAGAKGYLLKDTGMAELEKAIRSVMAGEMFLTPAVSKQVITDYMHRMDAGETLLDHLTRRQREVLQMIAEGRTAKEIAWELNLSVKTVETHRTQLMRRLEIYDVPGLVRYAIRMGIVNEEV